MVSQVQTSSPIITTHVADTKTVAAAKVADSKAAVVGLEGEDKASMSLLARQLADSAIRAEDRDKSMSRDALGELGARLKDQLMGQAYTDNKARHDLEVPTTEDPLLLARAKQATAYAQQSPSVPNPFSALSREQATLIAYDEKGPYTVNERRAAMVRTQELEQQWRAGALTRASQESINNGGRTPKYHTERFEHYKSLPAIEQAQHDEGYEGKLRADITTASRDADSGDRQYNLFEIIAGLQRPTKRPGITPGTQPANQRASRMINEPAPAKAKSVAVAPVKAEAAATALAQLASAAKPDDPVADAPSIRVTPGVISLARLLDE